MIKCPICGEENDSRAEVCRFCGAALNINQKSNHISVVNRKYLKFLNIFAFVGFSIIFLFSFLQYTIPTSDLPFSGYSIYYLVFSFFEIPVLSDYSFIFIIILNFLAVLANSVVNIVFYIKEVKSFFSIKKSGYYTEPDIKNLVTIYVSNLVTSTILLLSLNLPNDEFSFLGYGQGVIFYVGGIVLLILLISKIFVFWEEKHGFFYKLMSLFIFVGSFNAIRSLGSNLFIIGEAPRDNYSLLGLMVLLRNENISSPGVIATYFFLILTCFLFLASVLVLIYNLLSKLSNENRHKRLFINSIVYFSISLIFISLIFIFISVFNVNRLVEIDISALPIQWIIYTFIVFIFYSYSYFGEKKKKVDEIGVIDFSNKK